MLFWPVTLASASDKETKRVLIDATEKFIADPENERINIILLVELKSASWSVESLAGQKKENVLQWQKSVKPVAADDEFDLVSSSFSGSYEDVKGVQ